ncbi:uncharacterized protein [Amphiura filiformis]|uniref:uncharacterized protein n=1 Tax=Amphiura filiformis TaxID=82378 RepID=UPI003B21F27F
MALLFNWPRQSPYLSQLRKAKQKTGSSLDRDSPGHCNKPALLTRTQSAPEFNVPRELCHTYSARMDRAALAIGVCPGCKTQLTEEHDSPTRVSECKNMHHYSCPKCNSEYDVHRPGDQCTCPHLQHQHHHPRHPANRRPKSHTSPVHHSHHHGPFPPPAPSSSPQHLLLNQQQQ